MVLVVLNGVVTHIKTYPGCTYTRYMGSVQNTQASPVTFVMQNNFFYTYVLIKSSFFHLLPSHI